MPSKHPFSALTNQIGYLEKKSILECVVYIIGKSSVKFDIRYIIVRKSILFLTSLLYFAIKSKKKGKDQESIQSNTTPDPGHQMGK